MTSLDSSTPQRLPAQTTIKGLFDSEFQFAIPPYQRAYSWEEKQLAQFLLDLREQPPGKPYFLGHFLFEREESGGADSGQLLVIDGQQRLTTVVIFFSCLLRELKRRGEPGGDAGAAVSDSEVLHGRYLTRSAGNRLRTVDYDNPFFDRVVIEGLESTEEEVPRSQRLIYEARELFAKALQDENAATLATWRETVETAVVTDFEVPGKVQATQIFAFQNDRGVDLTELEKLKAFLMHKVYLHSAHRGEAAAVRDIEQHFADIYKLTERIKLGEDQVLRHHNVAFLRGWKNTALENIRAELKDEPEAARVKWIKGFCHDLRESFQHVAEIERQAERECAIADPLILDAPNSWPLLLKLFRFHRGEITSEPIQRILRLMEITLFKKAYSAGDYRSHGFHGAAKSYQGNIEALLAQLERWAQQGFQDYWAFNQGFRALLDGNYHFYPTTRYLLWKYENRLREPHRSKGMSPADFLNLYDETAWRSTIDHIMPQNPASVVLTQEFRDRYLNNLGNLVLMNLGKNASANNALPADKVETLANSTLISHKNVARMIEANGKWSEEEIEARKQEIVEFALDHWEAQSTLKDTTTCP